MRSVSYTHLDISMTKLSHMIHDTHTLISACTLFPVPLSRSRALCFDLLCAYNEANDHRGNDNDNSIHNIIALFVGHDSDNKVISCVSAEACALLDP